MTVVTLLEKAYGSFSPKTFEAALKHLCGDLKVKIRVIGTTTRDWIQIEITDEDEPVAMKLLDREVGLAPISAENVGKFSTVYGMVLDAGKSAQELRVDIGVVSPRVCDAVIPLSRLSAQLADGKKLSLKHLTDVFCLFDYLPLEIKIVSDTWDEYDVWQAELSEAQLEKISDWSRSNLDRLIVLGASREEVSRVVEASGHFRDVVRIEALGLFNHAILCKLGTDAIGLVPRLGPHLKAADLMPFSPRKIVQAVGKSFL